MRILRCSFLMVLIFACQQRKEVKSQLFEKAEPRGQVSFQLEEASGLVASVNNPGYLWTINDSNHPAEIFLIDDNGGIVLIGKLNNLRNRDWEDIAVGPGPEEGVNYLYIGEIGDNEAKYKWKYLYRLKEPIFSSEESITINEFDTIVFNCPDGTRDMESMAVDHSSGDLYMISKREENVSLYRVKKNLLLQGDTLDPEKLAILPYRNTVAADFSFNGQELLLKTYDEIYFWKRRDSLTITQALLSPPYILNYTPEPQGESIAWNLDGSGFYTLSESVKRTPATLFFYKKN